jgi:hypothetical protein
VDDAEAPPGNGRKNGRGERGARRRARELKRLETEGAGQAAEVAGAETEAGPREIRASQPDDPQPRRGRKRDATHRPRAPRSERAVATQTNVPETSDETDTSEALSAAAAELPPVIETSGKQKKSTRLTTRARKKQEAAVAALEAADDNPALGALNRHLNMLTQQLSTAHRVIGRVAAERDALRQQLADLQGIPVEEIVVSTIGTSTEQPTKSSSSSSSSSTTAPATKSALARLNYFGGDDVALMRRRRQRFAIALVLIVVVGWVAARMMGLSMPDKLSRDSLAALPYVGNLMAVFLAGWMFFRVIRVSSKGVRWLFPSDDPRRRRR